MAISFGTSNSNPSLLRFSPNNGRTIRADFSGGIMSSDFGPLLLRGIDNQIGLTKRLAAAFDDKRHPSYIEHPLNDLLAQRIYQVCCGYEDGNDSNELRCDPLFKMGVGRDPLNSDEDLASGPSFSRLEHAASRKDIYRLAKTFVEQFIAGYSKEPEIIVLEMDHSEDQTHGQQEFSFYNGYYGSHCYLPLFIFEGLSGHLVTAVLRTGKRPTGIENAMVIKRVLKLLRQYWPHTHIILRGDSHFGEPKLMELTHDDPLINFIFGLSSNTIYNRKVKSTLIEAKKLHQVRCHNAITTNQKKPSSSRIYEELEYTAGSWPQSYRVIVKAEVMDKGDNHSEVVTSLIQPTPQMIYEQLYWDQSNDENYIKAIKCDLKSDRTSDTTFLANHLRLYYAGKAYVLHHALRTQTLQQTEIIKAQPSTIIQKLFKVAVTVVGYKDRIRLRLPSCYPFKHLLKRITELLYIIPILNTS